MGINWKVNAEKDIFGKMDCLLGDYYKESYAPKVDFEVTLVEKISSDLTEILEYGVPITIHNSKKPSVHEEGLVYLNGYIRMIYNKATKSVYRLNYLSKKINIFNKDKSSLVKDGIRVIRDIVKALAEDSGGVMVHAAAFKKNDKGVLLIGGKGSGKTTLSLKFLYEYGCSEVSRDRVILRPEKQSFYIYGWPNYYNLTLRTMRDFSKTRSMLPEKYEKLSDQELDAVNVKIQCTADEIGIEQKCSEVKLTHTIFLVNERQRWVEDMEELLAVNFYSPVHLNYPNWHHWTGNNDEQREYGVMMAKKLLEEGNCHVVKWNTINEAVDKIGHLADIL